MTHRIHVFVCLPMVVGFSLMATAWTAATQPLESPEALRLATARMMAEYFEEMCVPKPFEVRRGQEFQAHRAALRERLLESIGLSPLPEAIPLDARSSEPLEHEFGSVRRVHYQLWPGVYSDGLLYLPKQYREKPAPAMLCPSGHFPNGPLYRGEQARALYFARLGYVVFAPMQIHYEDLSLGISHQTLLVWQNMRAVDYLLTLPEVDAARIGAAGCSGGGYQTAMMLALEPRVVVGSDVGYTEEYRSILFPHTAHCVCNHIPGVMRYTDQTEISALGLPKPIQYMVMNDQTRYFPYSHYPKVQDLYRANGASGRTDVAYFDTPHNYDRPKRERTYWWMEKWLRGSEEAEFPSEPVELEEKGTFPVRTLEGLALSVPEHRGWRAISEHYRARHLFKAPPIEDRPAWQAYAKEMGERLRELLGEAARLPSRGELPVVESRPAGPTSPMEVRFPGEAGLSLPATLLPPRRAREGAPVVVICSGKGRAELLDEQGPGSPAALAREGHWVVLLDTRFYGELDWRECQDLFATKKKGEEILSYEHIRYLEFVNSRAWERNSIVWGRPIAGMLATDISSALDGLAALPLSVTGGGLDAQNVTLVARDAPDLAVAGLFAAALDARIRSLDLDLGDSCYAKTETFGGWWLTPGADPSLRPFGLSILPFVLRHGDVLQWAALAADRRMILRNLPKAAGDPAWLSRVFAAAGNPDGLSVAVVEPASAQLMQVEPLDDGGVRLSWNDAPRTRSNAPRTVPFRDAIGLEFDSRQETELRLENALPDAFWAERGPLTLSMVVQPLRFRNPENALCSKWIASDGRRALFLGVDDKGRPYWAISASGNADRQRRQIDGMHALAIGKAWAVTAVFDPGKRMALYVNGHLTAELTESVPGRIFPCDTPLMLGARPGQTFADMVLGEVWFHPVALEEPAIQQWARQRGLTEAPPDGRTAWERAIFAPEQDLPPIRALTRGPNPHWFGYYDKFQTDPTDRYVLGQTADFDLRMPEADDVARIGMIDTADGDKWIPLTQTTAWNWQQGCMLQWRPGSDSEILFNDREDGRFVCRVFNVKTGAMRTLPRPISHVRADGKYALCEDFARIRYMRAVVGYAESWEDPNRHVPAPDNSGIWLMNLDTGEEKLIVPLSKLATLPYPNQTKDDRLYAAHCQWSPDGKRFLFFVRGDNVNSRLMTANMDGSDLRTITYAASHYDWLDPHHILINTRSAYRLYPDADLPEPEVILAVRDGHHSILPGGEWFVTDTIPMGPRRVQHVYLYHMPTQRTVPLGHFAQPREYTWDVRCDNHPRLSRDAKKIIIDSAHEGTRQMYMIDISGIVGADMDALQAGS